MKRFNDWLAVLITNNVGTMYCAYLFAALGITAMYGAFTGNVKLTLIAGSISGYFLQLVLLPIIIVGQNIQAQKHDQIMHHLRNLSPTKTKSIAKRNTFQNSTSHKSTGAG